MKGSAWTILVQYIDDWRDLVSTVLNNSHSHNTTDISTMSKLHFVHTLCRKSDMFRSILIIFRELLNISKTYAKK
jgi:hypothetical protein